LPWKEAHQGRAWMFELQQAPNSCRRLSYQLCSLWDHRLWQGAGLQWFYNWANETEIYSAPWSQDPLHSRHPCCSLVFSPSTQLWSSRSCLFQMPFMLFAGRHTCRKWIFHLGSVSLLLHHLVWESLSSSLTTLYSGHRAPKTIIMLGMLSCRHLSCSKIQRVAKLQLRIRVQRCTLKACNFQTLRLVWQAFWLQIVHHCLFTFLVRGQQGPLLQPFSW